MRRLSLIALVLLLALPATALASAGAVGDGSLAITGANVKSIVVTGKGLIYGHIDQGAVTLLSFVADDSNQFQISGAAGTPKLSGGGMRYAGNDMRFLISGTYVLKFDGSGINLSAIGKGTVAATAADPATDATPAPNGAKAQVQGQSQAQSQGPGLGFPTLVAPQVTAPVSNGTLAVNGGKPQPLGRNQLVAMFGSTKPGQ